MKHLTKLSWPLRTASLAATLLSVHCGAGPWRTGTAMRVTLNGATVTPPSSAEEIAQQLMPLVADVRELPFRESVPVVVLADEAFERVTKLERGRSPEPEQLQRTESPELAIYDPKGKRIVVRRHVADRLGDIKPLLAHELTHALQDQHFGLSSLWSRATTADSMISLRALVEGDAEITAAGVSDRLQRRPAMRALLSMQSVPSRSTQDLVAAGDVDASALTERRGAVLFAYEDGRRFAGALFAAGGFGQVNEAFRRPPQTSWEILHPEKYLAGISPSAPRPVQNGTAKELANFEMGPALLPSLVEGLCGVPSGALFPYVMSGRIQSWNEGSKEASLFRISLTDRAPLAELQQAFGSCNKIGGGREIRMARGKNELHVAIAPNASEAQAVLERSRRIPFLEPKTILPPPRRFPAPSVSHVDRAEGDLQIDLYGKMSDAWTGIQGTLPEVEKVHIYPDGDGIGFYAAPLGLGVAIGLVDAAAETPHEARGVLGGFVNGVARGHKGGFRLAGAPVFRTTNLGPSLTQDAFVEKNGATVLERVNLIPSCGGRQALMWTEFWRNDEGRRILDRWLASITWRQQIGNACLQLEREWASETTNGR